MRSPTGGSRFATRPAGATAAPAGNDAAEEDSKEGKMSAQGRSLAGWLRAKSVQSILVCLFYAASSITLSVVNKAVLSSYDFQCYFLLLAIQLVVGIVFCAASRRLGNPLSVPSIRDSGRLLAALPMAVCFVINVSVGFLALKLVNMPMFFCIRRLTPIFVMALDYLVLAVSVSRLTAASVLVSFVGTVLAGWDTFGDDALGYALAFANDVATALQLLFQKRFSDSQKGPDGKKISGFGLVYFNAVLALPMTLVGALVCGEFEALADFPYLRDRGFWGALLVSAVLGVVLTYAGILCTTFNSPLTTSMTGCAKDVVGTGLGALLFGDFDFTPTSTSGLGVSFLGSYLYVVAGLREARERRPAKAEDAASPRPAGSGSGGGLEAGAEERPAGGAAATGGGGGGGVLLRRVESRVALESLIMEEGSADAAAAAGASAGGGGVTSEAAALLGGGGSR